MLEGGGYNGVGLVLVPLVSVLVVRVQAGDTKCPVHRKSRGAASVVYNGPAISPPSHHPGYNTTLVAAMLAAH